MIYSNHCRLSQTLTLISTMTPTSNSNPNLVYLYYCRLCHFPNNNNVLLRQTMFTILGTMRLVLSHSIFLQQLNYSGIHAFYAYSEFNLILEFPWT